MNSKFLLTNAQSQLMLSKSDESKSAGLKSWQLALLIGIPSASIVAYLLYKRYSTAQQESNKKANSSKSGSKGKTQSAAKGESEVAKPAGNKKDDVERPKTELEKAIEIKNKGNRAFQEGNFDEAVRCYSESINLCPKNDKDELPKFYQNRAAAYENMKMYEKVVEDCTSALKIEQNYEKALTRRAKGYENLGKMQEAFEDLTSLCILQKFSANSMAAADRMVKKIGEKMSEEIFSTRKGIPISQHFVNNFYIGLSHDSVFKNQETYEKAKESSSSHFVEAIDAFNSGDFVTCIEACGKEINNESSGASFVFEARNLRGSLYMLKCQYAEARADFDFILKSPLASNRLKSNTYIKLTALNLQNNEEEEAYENYDEAIRIDPENEDVYCNRAQVYAMKGMFDKCFEDFDRCLQINPENRIAKIQKAFFQYRQFFAQIQMYAQATQTPMESLRESNSELREEENKLERVLNENADVPEALNLYAQILSEQENFEKAEKFYKLALEKDPRNAALMVQRALNHMTWKNDFDGPIQMLNEAIETDDTCEFAFETLATIEIQRGNLSRAVELFEKAVQLTRSKESMTNLCCMLVGAKTQFKVLNHFSNNPDILNTLNRNNYI